MRRSVRVAIVLVSVLAVFGLLAMGGSYFARQRILTKLAERSGADVSMGAVHWRGASIAIDDLTLRWPGDVARVRVRQVSVPFAWRTLKGDVSSVDVEGVRASIDTTKSANGLRRARGSSGGSRGGSARKAMHVRVQDVELDVVDARGRLLLANIDDVSLQDDEVHSDVQRVVLGEPDAAEGARASRASLTIERKDGVWTLEDARVAELEWVGVDAVVRGETPALIERVRAARAWWRGEQEAAEETQNRKSLLSRVLHASLEEGRVRWRGVNGVEVLLEPISAEFQNFSDGQLRVSGRGGRDGSRRIVWDFNASSNLERVEGDLRFDALPLGLVAPFLPDIPWHAPELARLEGALSLSSQAGLVRFDGRLRVEGAAISSARIAPVPVTGINASFLGRGALDRVQRALVIDDARFVVGNANAELRGRAEWASDHYLFDLHGRVPSAPCDAVIGMLPRSMLDEVAGFRRDGAMSAEGELFVDSRRLADTRVVVRVHDQCEFSDVPFVADLRRFSTTFTHRVLEPDGTTFEMETGPGSGAWTAIGAVSPFLVHAVLAHEDAGFFAHHGFVPSQFQVALARNLEARRYVQGASTITMQLVKNVFLHREKTLARKMQEALLTWWIERSWSKDKILELYLNVIEYGHAVYGIRNASQYYFMREPAELSLAESAFIANVLPNPKMYEAMYAAGRPSERMLARMAGLMRRMKERGRIDQAALDAGLAELATFRFARAGEERPAARTLVGGFSPLPIPVYDGSGAPESERGLEVHSDEPSAAEVEAWERPEEE